MIVLDTSAIMAVLLREPQWEDCVSALEENPTAAISAGTMAELRIVSATRKVADDLNELIQTILLDVISVTDATAHRVGTAYTRWGRGFHPASLNFGDCFAYVLAKDLDCPLLFVGDDFSKTDIKAVLKSPKKKR